jgi:uncharacterized surface protein with fasciclin (FAS1) repeats
MRIFPLILAITLLIAPAAFAQEVQDDYQSDRTLADVTAQTDDLSTLSAALEAAELGAAIGGDGPFTVFAPSNDAFDALPQGNVDALLLEDNREQLTDILTYHVVPGEYRAADLEDGQQLETLNGEILSVRIVDGTITVNGAEVVEADVEASNGVAHVISGVLLPEAPEPATGVTPEPGTN